MRRVLLTASFAFGVCLIALTLVTGAAGQSKKGGSSGCKSFARNSAEETDELLVSRINDAEVRECILHENYVFTNPFGVIRTRAQIMAEARSKNYNYTKFERQPVSRLISKETVVLVSRVHQEGTFRGKDISGDYVYTKTYVKKDGRWQLLAGQSTRVTTR